MTDRHALDGVLRIALGSAVPLSIERTAEGVSTEVYRVVRGTETFYLRLAERVDENLETDAALFGILREAGVRVSEIIFVSAFDPSLRRSVALTTEIRGAPVSAAIPSVLEAAGADLARINAIPVDGFGWVCRQGARWPMQAQHAAYEDFLTTDLDESLIPVPISGVIQHARETAPASGHLAHGDFDVSQIFCVGDRYTGLIDFGEIRGAEPTFDLGHFHLHDLDGTLLPALLRGYAQVTALPPDHLEAIRCSAILLGLRQLGRWRGRGLGADHPMVLARTHRIMELLRA